MVDGIVSRIKIRVGGYLGPAKKNYYGGSCKIKPNNDCVPMYLDRRATWYRRYYSTVDFEIPCHEWNISVHIFRYYEFLYSIFRCRLDCASLRYM